MRGTASSRIDDPGISVTYPTASDPGCIDAIDTRASAMDLRGAMSAASCGLKRCPLRPRPRLGGAARGPARKKRLSGRVAHALSRTQEGWRGLAVLTGPSGRFTDRVHSSAMSLLFWRAPRIPVLSLRGIIAAKPYAISLAAYREPIERAVTLARACKRLILSIESPGG